jgi:hypothetical protein
MRGDPKRLDEVVVARLLRLNAIAQGVVTGVVAGLAVFVATNWLVLKGGRVVGPNLALLSQFFIGYRVTFVGSLIGFAYAFVVGFAAGFLVSSMYNWLVNLRDRRGT